LAEVFPCIFGKMVLVGENDLIIPRLEGILLSLHTANALSLEAKSQLHIPMKMQISKLLHRQQARGQVLSFFRKKGSRFIKYSRKKIR
jgi:hypothetical protein